MPSQSSPSRHYFFLDDTDPPGFYSIGNTINSSLPHILRHGMAAVDPRHEYNRSFHLLNDKLKALRIDHEAAARESKAVATSTCKWGQDHLPYKREDGVGDEALADMYVFAS